MQKSPKIYKTPPPFIRYLRVLDIIHSLTETPSVPISHPTITNIQQSQNLPKMQICSKLGDTARQAQIMDLDKAGFKKCSGHLSNFTTLQIVISSKNMVCRRKAQKFQKSAHPLEIQKSTKSPQALWRLQLKQWTY